MEKSQNRNYVETTKQRKIIGVMNFHESYRKQNVENVKYFINKYAKNRK